MVGRGGRGTGPATSAAAGASPAAKGARAPKRPPKQTGDVIMTDAECEAELTRMGLGLPQTSAPPSPSRAAREEQAWLRDASKQLSDRSEYDPNHPRYRMGGGSGRR